MTPPRFVCDEMLGRLARWLRLLGYDATYLKHVEDAEVVAAGVAESRVVLTRDAGLARAVPAPPGALLVRSLDAMEQLAEVAAALGLTVPRERVLTRCSVCNARLEAAAAGDADVAEAAPPRVRERHTEYQRCPGCGRVYWEGTHAAEVRRVARRLREGAPMERS